MATTVLIMMIITISVDPTANGTNDRYEDEQNYQHNKDIQTTAKKFRAQIFKRNWITNTKI